LSLFEPHTEAIRKGQAVKPTEFGKLVKIQEAEAQFITDYTVCATRVPDQALWVPSLVRHEQLFGRAPHLAVADGGFASAANERAAAARGVRRVVLPRQRREVRRGVALSLAVSGAGVLTAAVPLLWLPAAGTGTSVMKTAG